MEAQIANLPLLFCRTGGAELHNVAHGQRNVAAKAAGLLRVAGHELLYAGLAVADAGVARQQPHALQRLHRAKGPEKEMGGARK